MGWPGEEHGFCSSSAWWRVHREEEEEGRMGSWWAGGIADRGVKRGQREKTLQKQQELRDSNWRLQILISASWRICYCNRLFFTSCLVRKKMQPSSADLQSLFFFFLLHNPYLSTSVLWIYYKTHQPQLLGLLLFPSEEHLVPASIVILPPEPTEAQQQCWCSSTSSNTRDKAVSAFLLSTLSPDLISLLKIWLVSKTKPLKQPFFLRPYKQSYFMNV